MHGAARRRQRCLRLRPPDLAAEDLEGPQARECDARCAVAPEGREGARVIVVSQVRPVADDGIVERALVGERRLGGVAVVPLAALAPQLEQRDRRPRGAVREAGQVAPVALDGRRPGQALLAGLRVGEQLLAELVRADDQLLALEQVVRAPAVPRSCRRCRS